MDACFASIPAPLNLMIDDQQQIYVRAANTYVSQGVNLYTIHGTRIFHGEMNDVKVKWLNERWKNAKRHCHCPPFHGPDITNAFRVKRQN